MKVLLITSYDSFLKSGLLVAQNIDNAEIDIYVHTEVDGLELSQNQLSELGISKKDIVNFHIDKYFESGMYENYDIVILSVGNSLLNRFFKLQYRIYHKQLHISNKALLITLFPGVIFGDRASILSRMLSDFILYLCPYDFEQGELIKQQHSFQCTNVLYGFSPLCDANTISMIDRKNYFIDQVIIPATREDRIIIVQGLIELAKRYPLEQFIILPRTEEGERTVHKDIYPYRELIKEFEIPSNLIVKRLPISQALSDMKLCISISSTVVFEALTLDIPIYIVGDLGIRDKFANFIFHDSGVMGTLSNLSLTTLPNVNIAWKNKYYYCCQDQALLLNNVIKNYKPMTHSYEVYKKELDKMIPIQTRILRKVIKLFKKPRLFFRDSICWVWLNKKY